MLSCSYYYSFCFHSSDAHRYLHSFPTRRSSDLAEAVKLQFRLEAFNAINHPWFGNPTGIGFISSNSIKPDASRMGEIVADRKSTRLNSSHRCISYAVFCLKKKKKKINVTTVDR